MSNWSRVWKSRHHCKWTEINSVKGYLYGSTAGPTPAFVRRHNRCFSQNGKILQCSCTQRLRLPPSPLPELRLAHTHPQRTNGPSARANITSGSINVMLRVTPWRLAISRPLASAIESRSIQMSLMKTLATGKITYRQQEINQKSNILTSTSAAVVYNLPCISAANITNDTL